MAAAAKDPPMIKDGKCRSLYVLVSVTLILPKSYTRFDIDQTTLSLCFCFFLGSILTSF